MIDKRACTVALMMLAIFLAGGFCGWWIGRNNAPEEEVISVPPTGRMSRPAQKEFLLNEFTRKLSLTSGQRTNVSNVLNVWMVDVQQADRDQVSSRHSAFQKFAPLVRTNLTEAQQKTYDAMTRQTERRFRRLLQK
jgi:uncharacterized membrane protein